MMKLLASLIKGNFILDFKSGLLNGLCPYSYNHPAVWDMYLINYFQDKRYVKFLIVIPSSQVTHSSHFKCGCPYNGNPVVVNKMTSRHCKGAKKHFLRKLNKIKIEVTG